MSFYTWRLDHSTVRAIRVDNPSVGVTADTPAGLDEAIRSYEAPFVAAAESERQAEENRRVEEARVQAGVGVDTASRPAVGYPGLVLETVTRPGQEVVRVV